MRFLEQIPENVTGQFGGVLHIAGWFGVDKGKEWPTLVPWLAPFDASKSKSRAKKFHLVVSDNDQYTSDYQGAIKDFAEKVGASSQIVSGGKHFNASEESAVLAAVEALIQ